MRATTVAVTTANSIGKMKERSRLVSSMTSTTEDMGPWVVAASNAAAPTIANIPSGTPGHTKDQAAPRAPPSSAPVASEGVNSPPGTPLPKHSIVAKGFSTNKVNSNSGGT